MQALPVERLKVRLLSCLDREKKVNNVAKACEAMDAIESVVMTKESLESSRLGLLINEVRRSNQLLHPDLAKRCRLLIKKWRKLISTTPTPTPTTTTQPAITDNGVDTAGVAPVAADDRAIRIRIKLGSSVNEATILGGQEKKQQQQLDNCGIEQAENRRKRKHISQNAPNNSKMNGISKTHLSAIGGNGGGSGETFSLASTVSKPCKPPRPPKLKTTAQLVADLTKCYPEELLVNINTSIGVDSTNALQQATASNSGDDAPSPALLFSAVEHQQPNGGGEVNKLELLEKYLAEDADQQQQNQDHVVAGSSSGVCTSSSSVDSDTSSRSSTPSRDKIVRASDDDDDDAPPRSGPDTVSSPSDGGGKPGLVDDGRRPIRRLPPVDRSMLDRLDEIPSPSKSRVSSLKYLDDYSNEPPERTRALAPFEQSLRMLPSEMRQLHSRVLVKTTDGRQVLALPYVDIGLPDFLEYDNSPATTEQLISWEAIRW
ncbi:transcription elongation factor S-II protein [Trichinella nativa]|uniref:Transcription elongation factor S-II protein n=1 Tax=Trichinella nativa TaxID=6335 RepID=A0A1Y3EZ03_9BILA|nr:transcription elongation factor S-II protein [Trichinella nativa]